MEKFLTDKQLYTYIKKRRWVFAEALENENLSDIEIQYLRGSLRELKRLEESLINYFKE